MPTDNHRAARLAALSERATLKANARQAKLARARHLLVHEPAPLSVVAARVGLSSKWLRAELERNA